MKEEGVASLSEGRKMTDGQWKKRAEQSAPTAYALGNMAPATAQTTHAAPCTWQSAVRTRRAGSGHASSALERLNRRGFTEIGSWERLHGHAIIGMQTSTSLSSTF